MVRLVEMIYTEEDMQELRKEIKNLKLTLEQMENTCKDYLQDRDTLREENRKLKEERDSWKEYQQRSQSTDWEQIERLLWEKIKLEEENKKLKKENKRLMSDLITTIEERDNAFKKIEQLKEEIWKLVMSKSKD